MFSIIRFFFTNATIKRHSCTRILKWFLIYFCDAIKNIQILDISGKLPNSKVVRITECKETELIVGNIVPIQYSPTPNHSRNILSIPPFKILLLQTLIFLVLEVQLHFYLTNM